MKTALKTFLIDTLEVSDIGQPQLIQSLWSGYGSILRFPVIGGKVNSVVVKNILNDSSNKHPRGWNTNTSHQRKLKSYEIETYWYQHWADQCPEECRVPQCFAIDKVGEETVVVLEDLNDVGYSMRKSHLTLGEAKTCLKWLANFHAYFINESPEGLWKVGTYWHLATRPDEFAVMQEGDLKQQAVQLDEQLNNCKYQTIVHGDAKVANFCFHENGKQVAAVDFQYVGGGCGIKDIIYFLSSCFTENECELYEEELLNTYFSDLKVALNKADKRIDINDLEIEWRDMYAIAWVDFLRFLAGWHPNHHKINAYSTKLMEEVLKRMG